MNTYHISFLDHPDWSGVPAVELQHMSWLPPCAVAARAQAACCGDSLHIRMEADERMIRAEHRGVLDAVCEDSCLEFFLAPLPGDRRYFNFELNPLGTLYLGFGAERPTRVRQIVKDPEMFYIRPFTTDRGWGVSFEIPLPFLRLYMPEASFSGTMNANFYKCGDKTVTPHYLAWSPLRCPQPDFHRRDDFGTLIFS